jgi:hypothetical protein
MADPKGPVYYSDGIDPVRRSSPEEVFLVTIEARPTPDAEDYDEAGGAFVNCWVDADDLRTAERRAVALIEEDGWRPHRFDSWKLVTRDTYADWEPDDEGEQDPREMVGQALADGEVCVFHTWPRDAPDGDEDE